MRPLRIKHINVINASVDQFKVNKQNKKTQKECRAT